MKRTMDAVLALVGLLILAPLLAAVALAVRVRLGSPVFFRQERPGLGGKPFEMVKFRTMLHRVDADGRLMPDSDRMTGFGRLLRSSSIDELPGLWNVLMGDMSLVGPRPLLMDYLPLYSPHQARRHEVRPGLTGWAQVNGRNTLGWSARLDHDVWYVDNRSMLLDLKILFMTAVKVLRRDGITQDGQVTMERFQGTAGLNGGCEPADSTALHERKVK